MSGHRTVLRPLRGSGGGVLHRQAQLGRARAAGADAQAAGGRVEAGDRAARPTRAPRSSGAPRFVSIERSTRKPLTREEIIAHYQEMIAKLLRLTPFPMPGRARYWRWTQ